MSNRNTLGGVIHTYQRYDPVRFPSPTQPPPALVSPAMEHLLMFGERRELTEEELARAIHLDPSQIAGLGPSIDALLAMLRERKRKILERYETKTVRQTALQTFNQQASEARVPKEFRKPFYKAVQTEQIRDLERLWYAADVGRPATPSPDPTLQEGVGKADDMKSFSSLLVGLIERLGEKYQVDELAAKYAFTGRQAMSVPQALAVKEELEKNDVLFKHI
jgi:hypothetical protein